MSLLTQILLQMLLLRINFQVTSCSAPRLGFIVSLEIRLRRDISAAKTKTPKPKKQ